MRAVSLRSESGMRGTRIHTAPEAFGKLMQEIQPHMAGARLFFNDFDTTAATCPRGGAIVISHVLELIPEHGIARASGRLRYHLG